MVLRIRLRVIEDYKNFGILNIIHYRVIQNCRVVGVLCRWHKITALPCGILPSQNTSQIHVLVAIEIRGRISGICRIGGTSCKVGTSTVLRGCQWDKEYIVMSWSCTKTDGRHIM